MDYHKESINTEHLMCKSIKIAYLLIVHKCPEQVNHFIRQILNYGDCDIYIHVDKKSSEMIPHLIKDKRVFIYSLYDVRWGSFEIVLAGLYLMSEALKSRKRYSHMYFGSGEDLLTKNGLYEYLKKSSAKVFIHIKGEVKKSNGAASRYLICWPKKLMVRNDWHLYRFIRIGLQILCRLGINVLPNKNKLKEVPRFYEGRTWFLASCDVIDYIVNYCEEYKDYVNFWQHSLASDLMFFQTIIMNSPYKEHVEDELMYVNFGKTFGTMNHPITITMNDIDGIKKGEWYYARKFDMYGNESAKQAVTHYLSFVNKCD